MKVDFTELKQNVKLFKKALENDFQLEQSNNFLLKVLMMVGDVNQNGFVENIKLKAVKKALGYGILKFKDPDNFHIDHYAELLVKAIEEMEKYFNE